MIAALAGLFFCQLMGEILVRVLVLPVPGPVAGMGLMFGFLVVRGRVTSDAAAIPESLGSVADTFLRHLSLLFIPAAVGVIQYLGLLRQFAWTIILSIALSTTAALVSTVIAFRLCSKMQTHLRRSRQPDEVAS